MSDIVITTLANMGFPALIAVILLLGYSKILKPLTETISELNKNIALLNEKVDRMERKVDDLT